MSNHVQIYVHNVKKYLKSHVLFREEFFEVFLTDSYHAKFFVVILVSTYVNAGARRHNSLILFLLTLFCAVLCRSCMSKQ